MSDAPMPSTAAAAPDISIRARPPSPRRLSRKVLLGGALTLASVVAFAVLYGLSERPNRRSEQQAETAAAAAGPPESIRLAPQNYAAGELGAEEQDLAFEANASLEAPRGEVWTGAQGASAPAPSAAEPVDPELAARTAPILFEGVSGDNDRPTAPPAVGAQSGFLAAQGGGDERLPARLSPPRSRYELMAGAVIPAALQTELNSDLAGRVIAQVTAPVFDSVTGRYLLIPQGSRLIGAYDSATAYGDRRLMLVWNRLILPNGWSINLEGMVGADGAGAAGIRDSTDNHLMRLTGAIALSAIVSVVANEAEDDEAESLAQSVGDAAAQEAARTGGRIIDRDLSVRPTLRVRAGAPVRVLVMRDINLRPYRE